MLPPVLTEPISNNFDKQLHYLNVIKIKMDFLQEELLIEEVRERQFIYDKSSRDYSDKQKRINAYEEIALVMGLSAEVVTSKWESLKKQFQQYTAKLKNPSGSGAKKIPLFRHANTMSFLKGHFRNYSTESNVKSAETEAVTDTENSIQVDFVGFDNSDKPEVVTHVIDKNKSQAPREPPKKRKRDHDLFEEKLLEVLEKPVEAGDEYDHFGANLAGRLRQIKNRSKKHAITLQFNVHKLFHDVEIELLEECEEQAI